MNTSQIDFVHGTRRHAATLGFALLVAFGGVAQAADPVGNAAPNCSLTPLGEGTGVDLKQFRGKVVYLDFWASWCTTCVKSFPFMNELVHEFGPKGVQIVGVNLDEKPENAKNFLVKHPAHFTLAADKTGACPRSFEVKAMPATYLIDKSGVVRYKHYGFKDDQAEEIRTQLAALLAEQGSQ